MTILHAGYIRILSLEDEPVVSDRIKRLCEEILGDRIALYMTCDTVDDALKEAASGAYDLFLLDLNLHGEDGFALLRDSASYAAQTIIISAYKDRASEAFDFGVTDFVAKPFDQQRLELALQRYDGVTKREKYPRYLSFLSLGKAHVVPLEEVKYIAGADKYSEVHMIDGSERLHSKSLHQFEQLLPDGFDRIHKSYIVCANQIERLENMEGSRYFVILKTGEKLPVGRTRYKSLKEKYL